MTEPESRSFTAVAHGIVGNVEDLVQAELQLAKAELVQAAHQGARAGWLRHWRSCGPIVGGGERVARRRTRTPGS